MEEFFTGPWIHFLIALGVLLLLLRAFIPFPWNK